MLNEEIKNLIKEKVFLLKKAFVPWTSLVPVSGKVFDETELEYMIEAVLDCHRTEGRWNDMFEKKLAAFLWIKYVMTTNSWSSANLLAITSLMAKELWERQLHAGDEVITVAAWFPTTINPIIQNGLIPVFVDVDLATYEVNIDELKKAISPKTKAIMIAHTLGNAFNIDEIQKLCKEHNLRLIEDTCDALWTTYDGKFTGTFGDIGTLSFYPAHHITMGEWGALITNNPLLVKIIKSYRDWGRDCRCGTGMDNTCNNRFKWKIGDLPEWFDHKYIYSRIGYNLKISDTQAALWLAQLGKLEWFIQARKNNFAYLKKRLLEEWLDKYFILPQATEKSDPSWFGFLLSLKEDTKFTREEIMEYLNSHKIWTRLLFSWNFTKQPAFLDYVKNYRIVGDLKNTDYIMNHTFWLWVYPGLTEQHLDYVILHIKNFIDGK